MTARTIINPAIRILAVSFDELKTMFTGDLENPAFGQRDPQLRNQSGLGHITGPVAMPSTQAVLQAVEYAGSASQPLKLIDGYRRLAHWVTEGCPFELVYVIVHTIAADSTEDATVKTEALASTIDNRSAVKSKADRWCAAIREAGIKAKSTTYQSGTDMQAYLGSTIGSSRLTMLELVSQVTQHAASHAAMDELFRYAEHTIPSRTRRKLLHPGVATALFNLANDHGTEFLKTVRSALLYCAGYVWEDAPMEVVAFASHLQWISSSKTKTEFQALCESRKDYYEMTSAAMQRRLKVLITA